MRWRAKLGIATICIAVAAASAVPTALAGIAVEAAPVVVSLDAPAKPAAYNKPIALTGSVEPPAAGLEIVLQRSTGAGKALASAVTSADGAFRAKLSLKEPVALVARAVASGALSQAVQVAVRPKISVKVAKAAAFTDTTVKIVVDPHGARGVANLTVKYNGKTVQTARTRVRKGRANETIVAPGPGSYAVLVEFDPPAGYAAAQAKTSGKATTRVLKVGSKGRDVSGLIRKLRALNFHVPAPTQSFTASLSDPVIAFQKVAGLRRTGVMGEADWKALARARPVEATRQGPPNRIEVDKSRQILIKVRGGEVAGVLPVSTGVTGNTPEGIHNILWKAPQTTTWLGPGILYRTLTFVGNSFAIHGWSSVPAYPASHGCIRIPIWTADWLYDRSPVGETVIVHR